MRLSVYSFNSPHQVCERERGGVESHTERTWCILCVLWQVGEKQAPSWGMGEGNKLQERWGISHLSAKWAVWSSENYFVGFFFVVFFIPSIINFERTFEFQDLLFWFTKYSLKLAEQLGYHCWVMKARSVHMLRWTNQPERCVVQGGGCWWLALECTKRDLSPAVLSQSSQVSHPFWLQFPHLKMK